MISGEEAVKNAAAYLQSLIATQPGRAPVLEELEKSGSEWLVTLSYFPATNNPYGLGVGGEKEYKIFRIEGLTGQIVSMKIRTLK